jgi:hypothetical protein
MGEGRRKRKKLEGGELDGRDNGVPRRGLSRMEFGNEEFLR